MRLLRHDAAVPDQRAEPLGAPDRRRGARHVRPREPEADREPGHARDADPARVAGAQRAPRPARRGDGQPDRLPRHRRRLRPQRGLPHPGAAELAAGRHLRPRVRLRARRQHLLRDLDLHGQHHRGRPVQPEGPDDPRDHRLQLARPDDLRRRQPRLRRRQPGPVHPRHERDPGAQAGRELQGGLQARLARAHDPAGRAPDHDRRPALPGRDRRVLQRRGRRLRRRQRPEGRRRPDHRHRRRAQPEGRLEHPPRRAPAREPGEDRRRPRRAELRPGLRGPLLQRPAPRQPGDPRLLDDRERPADLRHPRPAQPARDGLLRRAEQDQPERGGAEQLRDVEPVVRARAQRGLVHGRQLRLLQRQARRLAVRGRRGRRPPRATAPATPASARCRRRRRAAACGWPSRAGARGR